MIESLQEAPKILDSVGVNVTPDSYPDRAIDCFVGSIVVPYEPSPGLRPRMGMDTLRRVCSPEQVCTQRTKGDFGLAGTHVHEGE